ncbi:hypothetical protein [Halomonas alkalicola]|uniref:hypothetical protein n=1 Tax=Halomonas alkalicola TaxID=1930622 RepID=UPI00265ED6A2|nr:hypothetical protein [Halomonas alkalicola]
MGYPAAAGMLTGLLMLGGCSLFPDREPSDDPLMLEETALMATVTADGELVFYRMEPSRTATGQGRSRSRHKMLGFDGGTQTVLAAAHRLDDTETQSLMQRLMAQLYAQYEQQTHHLCGLPPLARPSQVGAQASVPGFSLSASWDVQALCEPRSAQ